MHRRGLKFRQMLLRSCLPVLRRVEPNRATRIVARLGRLEYLLVPRLRRRFETAVAQARDYLGADWDIQRVGAELAANQVRWRVRDMLLDGRTDRELARHIRVAGEDHLREARDEGRGVVLLGNHFGSHLMPAHYLQRQGVPLRLFMERPHHVSRQLSSGFDSDGPLGQKAMFVSRRADAAESARSIFRAAKVLKAGYVVFIAGDVRWEGRQSVETTFLGRPCRISTTWVALAALSGAPVVPAFCGMADDGSHDLSFSKPFHVPAEAAHEGGAGTWAVGYLREIERRILSTPGNSNDYLFWSEPDDTAHARRRLSEPPSETAPARRTAA